MPENQPAEPNPRIELLYIGCRENERGKPLCHLWYDLTGIVNDGNPLKDEQARHQIYDSKKKGRSTQNIAFASQEPSIRSSVPTTVSSAAQADTSDAGPAKTTC